MTEAKKKAKELVYQYHTHLFQGKETENGFEYKTSVLASLICVDEKIETVEKLASNEGTDWGELEYLQEVKQEILNL